MGTVVDTELKQNRVLISRSTGRGKRNKQLRWYPRAQVREWGTNKMQTIEKTVKRTKRQHITRNLTKHKITEEGKKWILENRDNPTNNIVGCSDGSVYDHKLAGGYAWALYERLPDGTLRHIGVTGLGREICNGLEVNSIHSYRMEAVGILAPLTYLKQAGWKGTIEWYTDCKGVINTTKKLKYQKFNQWYAQRDKDVWSRIKDMTGWYTPKLTICHVKAHTDDQAEHINTPEESANQDMAHMQK